MVRLVLSKKERKLRRQQRREASRLHTLADLEGSYTAGVLGFVATLSPVRPWVSCECSDFGDLEELLADEEAAGAGRGGLKGALSKRRAVQQAVNQAEQRHRTAVNRAMAVSGDQDVMKRERHTKRTFADDAEAEKHFGRGGPDRDGAGGAELSEDEAYTSAVKQRARKRARKQEAHEEVLYVAAWLWVCVCVCVILVVNRPSAMAGPSHAVCCAAGRRDGLRRLRRCSQKTTSETTSTASAR